MPTTKVAELIATAERLSPERSPVEAYAMRHHQRGSAAEVVQLPLFA